MIIDFSESISGAKEGQPSKLGYECRKVRKAAADIKPGRFVCRSSTDNNCKVPTTVAEVQALLGCTVLSDTIPLDSDGEYASGLFVPIFSKAPGVWMSVVDAVTEGGQVYCYYAGSVAKGRVGGTFVSGENFPIPNARFGSTQATPDGLAEVEFSLPGGGQLREGFGSGKGYVDVVVDLASIPANTAPDQSTLVTGSLVGDVFQITSLTALTVGSVICEGRCRVAGTVVWRVANVTVGAIDNASNTFRFTLLSREQG